MKRAATELSPLEATFLEELLKSPNEQGAAYKRACIALGRSLPKSVGDSAHALMQRPRIAEIWEDMKRTRAIRVQVTTDMVLEDLWGVLQVDAVAFAGADGLGMTIDELRALTKHQRRAIRSMRRRTMPDGTIRIRVEVWNREKLLELAGKHTGAWAKGEQLVVQGDVNQTNVVYVVGVPEKIKDVEAWTKKNAITAPRK